jgi:4-amino-4-deoxy-L-arabinose transferase-like glycosyltransferase
MTTAAPSRIGLSLQRVLKSRMADDFAHRKVWLAGLTAIVLIAGATFASLAHSRPKFNRSEIAYAEISREMMEKSSYIVPLYRSIPSIDKPVLNYWAIIPCFKAFGTTGFAARIPSLVASIGCLILFAFGIKRLWGWQTSLLSTMILATSQRFWEFATLCMTDMLLTLFDTVSLTALYVGLKNEKSRWLWYCVAAVSMGLGTLTKGPVALILPAASFFIYLVSTRQLRILSIAQIAIAAIVFFAVAAPWYVAAAATMDTPASIAAWLWHHNFERYFGSAYAFHYSPLYMVQSLFLGFAPWSAILPFALFSAVKRWRNKTDVTESKEELYLWIWLVLTTTFFTFSRGKMNYYDLPAFPAAAGIVGLHLHNWIKNKQPIGSIFAWLLTVAMYAGTVVSALILPQIAETTDVAAWVMMPACFLACALYSTWALFKDRPRLTYAAAFVGMCGALLSFSLQLQPAFARQAPAIGYIEIFKQHPEARIAIHSDFAKTIDWFDAALFETRRAPDQLDSTDDLAAYLVKPGQALVIVPQDRFRMLPQDVQARTTVIRSMPYMQQKLDLGFLAKGHGKLTGSMPLLLVSNQKPGTANVSP